MKKIKKKIYKWIELIYLKYFISVKFYRFNQFLFRISLRGLGILNYKNDYESGENYFLKSYLKSLNNKPIIFDIGACGGSYSNVCREIRPDSLIYAFEPNPKSFENLKINFSKFENLNLFDFGFGSKKENLIIYDIGGIDHGTQHASIYKEVLSDIHKYNEIAQYSIKLETLDNFFIENKIAEIDLIKIDTEGNELKILEGGKSLIPNHVKCFQIEFNEMNIISRSFLKDFIKLLSDYNFYRLLPDGLIKINYSPLEHELFGFHNIVAFRKDLNLDSMGFKIK